MTVLLLGVLTILTPACSDSTRSILTQDVSTYRDDVEHHFELGFTLQNIGDLEGAIAEYRTALRLNPNHANAHYNLGVVLQSKRDLEGAIAEYRAALRLNPSHATAHYNLGVVLQDIRKPTEAAREFRESLRFIPESPANRGKIDQVKDKLSEIGLGETR
jgi:tetratricopeptide (TPR) repeat protein